MTSMYGKHNVSDSMFSRKNSQKVIQTNHNKHKVDSIQNNDQLGSKPKRAKSPETNTGQNFSNKKPQPHKTMKQKD